MSRITKVIILTLVLIILTPVSLKADIAIDSKCQINSDVTDVDLYQKKYLECQDYISQLSKTVGNIAGQIKFIDSQIQLTLLRISQAQNNINLLEKQIVGLTNQINDLDISLNRLSSIYINQAVQNYKLQKRVPYFSYLFNTDFNSFFDQYKYIATAQNNSQNTLILWETTRTNFNNEKETKQKKQTELESLQKVLSSQKANLANQKIAESTLLSTTQKQLDEAIKQLDQLKNFTKGKGNSCLSASPDSGSDGWYYSQRDPRWCQQTIGFSSDTVGQVGCFITSVSMIWKKYGFDMNPSLYAANPIYFLGATAWMSNPAPPPGYSYNFIKGHPFDILDNELKNNRPVIVQISMNNISGMHFIVIKSGSNGNYQMHDPWYGADLSFNNYYSVSQIMSLRLVTK